MQSDRTVRNSVLYVRVQEEVQDQVERERVSVAAAHVVLGMKVYCVPCSTLVTTQLNHKLGWVERQLCSSRQPSSTPSSHPDIKQVRQVSKKYYQWNSGVLALVVNGISSVLVVFMSCAHLAAYSYAFRNASSKMALITEANIPDNNITNSSEYANTIIPVLFNICRISIITNNQRTGETKPSCGVPLLAALPKWLPLR